jgi:acyl carrier protein
MLARGPALKLPVWRKPPIECAIEAACGVPPETSGFAAVREGRGFRLAGDREQVYAAILKFIRSEIQDKEAVFDMDTPIDTIKIDSIDVIHVIFKVEEEYNVTIDLPQDAKFATVGDFVRALADFIPSEQA